MIKSRRLRQAGQVARIKEGTSDFKMLTDKRIGTRPVGRPMHRWEINIRIYLKYIGIELIRLRIGIIVEPL